MTKQEVIQELNYLKAQTGHITERMQELQEIINAPEPDPRIGKLVWFGNDEHFNRIGELEDVRPGFE